MRKCSHLAAFECLFLQKYSTIFFSLDVIWSSKVYSIHLPNISISFGSCRKLRRPKDGRWGENGQAWITVSLIERSFDLPVQIGKLCLHDSPCNSVQRRKWLAVPYPTIRKCHFWIVFKQAKCILWVSSSMDMWSKTWSGHNGHFEYGMSMLS